jgi:hypothetical protein
MMLYWHEPAVTFDGVMNVLADAMERILVLDDDDDNQSTRDAYDDIDFDAYDVDMDADAVVEEGWEPGTADC